MSISLLPDISAKKKRKWLGVLLWGVFLFSRSLCDDVLGPPPPPPVTAAGDQDQALTSTATATKTSTITVTTTMAYKPSLIPGNSDYTFLGCYSQPTEKGKGGVFASSQHDVGLPADNLTISRCLESCASASEKGKGKDKDLTSSYIYAGLRNGR
jgi:hypothetical protein